MVAALTTPRPAGVVLEHKSWRMLDSCACFVWLPRTSNTSEVSTPSRLPSRLTTTLQGGHPYWIVVDGFGSGWTSAQGQYTLSVTLASAAVF